MRKLSSREKSVLEALDEEIQELETKLQKVQPLFDELGRLRKARAVMLDERSTTGTPRGGGGGRAGTGVLTMETVINYLREHGHASTREIADYAGTSVGNVRAHLNRYRDERYRQNGGGNWELIGNGAVEDDEGEEDDDE
jgi:hypothetical protein